MTSARPRKFWRVYDADGGVLYLSWNKPELAEGETAIKVGLDGVTWREYAEMMDRDAADSHSSYLEGTHEWLARRIIRAAGDENRLEGEVIAQKVMRSIYEESGGLHGLY
jgi:hypothetical protein